MTPRGKPAVASRARVHGTTTDTHTQVRSPNSDTFSPLGGMASLLGGEARSGGKDCAG